PGGVFSSWACESLRPGAMLESMPPQGRFALPEEPGERRHVLAFAAGAGITPIVAMAEHAMRRQRGTRFTLVYGNRDTGSIIFRERLEDLKDAFVDRFTLLHILSRNEESETPLLEGRIDAAKVEALSRHLFAPADVDQVFLCGPGSMIRDVRNALFALGFARDRVHHEFFAAGGGAFRVPPPPSADTMSPADVAQVHNGAEITAILDGQRHRFTARPDEAVVEAALRAGVRAPYSCKGGMCSTCRARVVEGKAGMRVNYSLEPWEVEKGFVLTCQAVPETPRLVVDYDQM
ncbi:MAG: 2Fe-2S iron-sulfur cluster-binding protein, partial [Hyphomicrobiaceae bacterium]